MKTADGETVTNEARKEGAATENAANLPREAGFDFRCTGHQRVEGIVGTQLWKLIENPCTKQ